MISSLKATCHPGSPLPVWLWHPGSIPNSNKSSVDHCKKSTKKLLLQVEFLNLLLKTKKLMNRFPSLVFLRDSWRLPNLHVLLLSLHEVPQNLQKASKVNWSTKIITYLKRLGFKDIVIENHQWDVDKKDNRLLTYLSELYTNCLPIVLANFPALEPAVAQLLYILRKSANNNTLHVLA